MTKLDLIATLSRMNCVLDEYKVSECVNEIFDYLSENLKEGDKVEVRGFGSFTVKTRASRIGRNPKTGEAVSIPERRVVLFKPGKELTERVNGAGDAKMAGMLRIISEFREKLEEDKK